MDRRVIVSGGVRSARRRPPSVAWATVKAFDAAGGPPGATRRATHLGRQAASKRLPDAQASRCTLFLACRPISAVPHLSMVRIPGLPPSPRTPLWTQPLPVDMLWRP